MTPNVDKKRTVPGRGGPCTAQEIEERVIFVRLELYNSAVPCGPKAIRCAMDRRYHVRPLPSERTIAGILARNGLTHRRTGRYHGKNL